MRRALALLGVVAVAVAVRACSDVPVVSNSFLQSPKPSFTDGTVSIYWTRVSDLSCADQEIYRVVTARQQGQFNLVEVENVLCEVTADNTCIIQTEKLLELNRDSNTFRTVLFFVLLYPQSSQPQNYTYDANNGPPGFSVCMSLDPTPTTLIAPANETVYDIAESVTNTTVIPFTFRWNASDSILGFGRYCGGAPLYQYRLAISKDLGSLDTEDVNALFPYSQDFSQTSSQNAIPIRIGRGAQAVYALQDVGVFYWRVFNRNNVVMKGSPVYQFELLVQPDPCDPPCVAPFGYCNVTFGSTGGFCNCTAGYSGPTCATPPPPTDAPSQTQPPQDDSNRVALGAGVGVAGGVVLITIIVVVLYILRERWRARKDLEMSLILIQAPEYASIAWSPYNLVLDTKIDSAKKAAWTRFEQLVLSQDFYVVHSFVGSAKLGQMDAMLACLVCLFCRHHAATQLVESLMIREIETFEINQASRDQTSDASGLIPFREDSAATKAFKVYARVTGLPYLFETLGQLINDFCSLLDEEAKKEEKVSSDAASTYTTESAATGGRRTTFTAASMEVDPSRMGATDDQTTNRLALQLICQKLFVKIYRSTAAFPVELRSLCARVKDKAKTTPTLQSINLNLVLANLVFLRFINPAVLLPQQHGLVKDEPMPSTKRQLVLITKVLQNLAGGVEFGKKEQYMTKLNPFIQQNSDKMQGFLNDLATSANIDGTSATANYAAPITDEQFSAALVFLYRHMTQHFEEFGAVLAQEASPVRAEAIRSGLVQCMADLGTL